MKVDSEIHWTGTG